MYQVLIVDDEMPALRYMNAIVEKYAPGFAVAQTCVSGEAALSYMKEHPVDLLLTDISMPSMDGISLALKAREMHSGIHIIIVTGYADFEYAKGAIRASVDDYILKPVSVSQMREVLDKLRLTLDEEQAARIPQALTALFARRAFDEALLTRQFGGGRFWFALLRWGNLGLSRGPLKATSVIPLQNQPFTALYGRDEEEQLLFMPVSGGITSQVFHTAAQTYADKVRAAPTQTLLFCRNPGTLQDLPDFFDRAANIMEHTVIIGRHQASFLTGTPSTDQSRHLSGAALKRLEHLILDCNTRMVKDAFVSYAVEWERSHLPQMYASIMVQQLVHLVLSVRPVSGAQQDAIMKDVSDLLLNAASYGDLMSSLYSVLFDMGTIKDKKLSTEDLYQYAVAYIQENYAKSISIQNVCAEIGISQTYLSRLFRKHGSTSFNAFLTQYRLNMAMSLMREHPDMALRNVAACVGYDDYAYFSKVFHQVVGMTPSQWLATQSSSCSS